MWREGVLRDAVGEQMASESGCKAGRKEESKLGSASSGQGGLGGSCAAIVQGGLT